MFRFFKFLNYFSTCDDGGAISIANHARSIQNLNTDELLGLIGKITLIKPQFSIESSAPQVNSSFILKICKFY